MKNLEGILNEADHLRHNASVETAIRAYLEAAEFAKNHDQLAETAYCLVMSAVTARQAIRGEESTKLRDALTYFQAAESIYRELHDDQGLGRLYRERAVVYDCARKYPEALSSFQRSIELLEKNTGAADLALAYAKLGRHFYRTSDLPTAKNYFLKALDLFREYPNRGYYMATTWLDYARALARAGESEAASEWAEQSLSWYEADHDGEQYNRRRAQLYGLLSVLYDLHNKDKQARDYAKRYERLLKDFDPGAAQVLRDELRTSFNDAG